MFQNSWSLKLSQPAQSITIACLPSPSWVYQGHSNQLSVYSNNETHALPIRKQVLALNTINKEHVLILTKYSLICFDLLNNQERFNLQFQNAERMFVIDDSIYVVSGESLYSYNANGEENYVNHLSAGVVAITKVQKNGQPTDQIVIATADSTMLRYSKLNIVFDYGKIIGKATSLCWIGKGVLVGSEEGPIAFYESKKSKWKAKSIHKVCKILKFKQISEFNKNVEFQTKKQDKIIVARADGNLEIRDWETGGTLNKIKCGEDILDVFVTDFRAEGSNQIVAVLVSGNIRAFNIKDQVPQNEKEAAKTSTAEQTIQKGNQIQRLNQVKQQLLHNISQIKNALQQSESNENSKIIGQTQILRPDFKIVAALNYNQGLVLQLSATNGYISGLTFEQPIMPVIIQKTQNLKYKFQNSSQSVGDVTCQVLVHSNPSATKFQVKVINIHLPKFWKWGLDPSIRKQISGKLKFKILERNARFILWMKQCFFMNLNPKQQEKLQALNEMKFRFYNFYQDKQMEIIVSQNDGTIVIKNDCMKTLGQIFQDLVNYCGIKNLNSQLQFPEEKQKIKQLLDTVERLSQTKVSMSTEVADSINAIKFLLVKGESARVVGSMNSFRKTYAEIMQQNRNLITEIEKKNLNTKTLTQTLKSVNSFINQIANVRYGEAKNQVIAKCRQAIKTKRFPEIFSIMDKGAESF